jgi:hypothetical protein
VATADHGEAFGEHGEVSHSLFVYDTTLHVPLILRGEGAAGGRRVATTVGIADVAATVLARVGGAGPSLRGETSSRPASAGAALCRDPGPSSGLRVGATCAPGATAATGSSAPAPELYDVAADPGDRGIRRRGAGGRPQDGPRPSKALWRRRGRRRAAALPIRRRPSACAASATSRVPAGAARAPTRRTGSTSRGGSPRRPGLSRTMRPRRAPTGRSRPSIPTTPSSTSASPTRCSAPASPARPSATFAGSSRPGPARPRPRGPGHRVRRPRAARRGEKALRLGLAIDAASGQIHYNLGEIARVAGDRERARRVRPGPRRSRDARPRKGAAGRPAEAMRRRSTLAAFLAAVRCPRCSSSSSCASRQRRPAAPASFS